MSADDRAVIGRRGLSGRWLATLQGLDGLVELFDAEIDRHLPQRVRPVMVRRRHEATCPCRACNLYNPRAFRYLTGEPQC